MLLLITTDLWLVSWWLRYSAMPTTTRFITSWTRSVMTMMWVTFTRTRSVVTTSINIINHLGVVTDINWPIRWVIITMTTMVAMSWWRSLVPSWFVSLSLVPLRSIFLTIQWVSPPFTFRTQIGTAYRHTSIWFSTS